MSNEIATMDSLQTPDYAQTDGTAAAGLVVSITKNRISLKDSKFVVKEDGVDEKSFGIGKPIAVVILGVSPPEPRRTSKIFYSGAWVEGSNEAPDCFSSDGVRPDPSIHEPQHDSCATCPQNAWGSGTAADGSAGKSKACSDRKILIVSLFGKEGVSDAVFELSVPPTSLKALSKYGQDLVKANGNMSALVTRVGLNEAEAKQMTFSPFKYLDEAPGRRALARAKSDEILQMVSPTIGLPAPATESAMPETPEYVEAEIIEEVMEEPVAKAIKKKAVRKKAVKKAEPVAEVIEESDSDFDELSSVLDDLPGL